MSLFLKIKERLSKNKKLNTYLLAQTSFMLIASIGAIIIQSDRESSHAMLESGRAQLDSAMSALNDTPMDDAVRISQDVMETFSQLISNINFQDINNSIPILNIMSYFLENYGPITSVLYGTPSGFFFEITESRVSQDYIKQLSLKLPKDVSSLIKIIQAKDGKIGESLYVIQDKKTLLKIAEGNRTSYDPRTRPWYLQALKTKQSIWTPVYMFTDSRSKEMGLTNARSLYDKKGKFLGVLGIDVGLKNLADAVANIKISPNTLFYVVDKSASVVVSSKTLVGKGQYDQKEMNYLLSKRKDSQNSLLKEAIRIKSRTDKRSFIFTHNDAQYIAFFEKFTKKKFPHSWQTVVLSPVSDFTTSVVHARNMTIFYATLILLLSLLWSYVFSRRLARPILELSAEAQNLQKLDLEERPLMKTKITEIVALRDAILGLKTTMQSFSYYIPKDLVKKLLGRKRSIHVGGKSKEAAFMFTDIANFTNISEALSADKVVRFLSEYFEEMASIIMKNGGAVDKYIGDAIMACWGMTGTERNLAYNTCRAALLCQQRLEIINRVWTQEGRPLFHTRFGLHMGTVIMGNVGSSDRMNYTAIGDNVNLSSRLESLNKQYGTTIIVSEAIYEATRKHFLFRRLDNVAVKGKDKPIVIYELLGQLSGDDSLYPSQYQIEFCQKFEEARALYMTRQWPEALKAFKTLLKYPHSDTDKTLDIYIGRCEDLIKNPPPPEWDGAIHLYQK